MRTVAVKYRFCSRLLVGLAVLCLCVIDTAAIPLSEYRSAVEVAIATLEPLVDKGGHESDTDYEARLTEAIAKVRTALPKNQQVEFERESWGADNAWLHTALDDLQGAKVEERQWRLTSVVASLSALNDRVKALEGAGKGSMEHKGASKQKLESILDRPEYAAESRGPNALTKLVRDFIRWLESLMPKAEGIEPGRARTFSNVVTLIVVGVAVLLILYVAMLLYKRFKRPARPKVRKKREARIVLGEKLQPEQTATDLLAEAEALARSGDLRAAIRKGYIALLVELGDRDIISLAQYKTNRDYLRSVSNLPQLHSPLKRLTETFERHWYGFANATPSDWQDFRARYREALQTGN
ncbi:MAG TPA: DUF4129 domain-containing protein [Pyrinomonadaceae bacterium]|nr:DUF4129 domain-containing protein [Pyrinomonadaceae bacterium]